MKQEFEILVESKFLGRMSSKKFFFFKMSAVCMAGESFSRSFFKYAANTSTK